MTITLDYKSCLLHLPMTRRPIDYVSSVFDKEEVKILLMCYLGSPTKTEAFATAKTGARVSLTWLEDLYNHYVELDLYI